MEKLKRFSENPIWRLFMDFVQLTGVSFFTVVGSIGALKLVSQNWTILVLLLILLTIVGFWLYHRFNDLYKSIRDEKVRIETDRVQKKIEGDFLSGIPSNRVVESWFSIIQERAKQWDPGAFLTSLNMYFDRGHETEYFKPLPTLQAYYWSPMKQLLATFYTPSSSKIGKVEEEKYPGNLIKPFFKKYPTWRNALKRSYTVISDIIPDQFHVQIADDPKGIDITFTYLQGIVEKRACFSYDGSVLKNDQGKQFKVE